MAKKEKKWWEDIIADKRERDQWRIRRVCVCRGDPTNNISRQVHSTQKKEDYKRMFFIHQQNIPAIPLFLKSPLLQKKNSKHLFLIPKIQQLSFFFFLDFI